MLKSERCSYTVQRGGVPPSIMPLFLILLLLLTPSAAYPPLNRFSESSGGPPPIVLLGSRPSSPRSSEEGRVRTFSPGAQLSSLLYFHAGPSCSWPSLSPGTPGTMASTVVCALSISVAKAAFQEKNLTQTRNVKNRPD